VKTARVDSPDDGDGGTAGEGTRDRGTGDGVTGGRCVDTYGELRARTGTGRRGDGTDGDGARWAAGAGAAGTGRNVSGEGGAALLRHAGDADDDAQL